MSRGLANHVLCVALLFCIKYSLTEEFRSVSLLTRVAVLTTLLLYLGSWSHELCGCRIVFYIPLPPPGPAAQRGKCLLIEWLIDTVNFFGTSWRSFMRRFPSGSTFPFHSNGVKLPGHSLRV